MKSHPVRGAWIEILTEGGKLQQSIGSHPVRGAWIEILIVIIFFVNSMSHPVRGAWIEIFLAVNFNRKRRYSRIP